MQKGTISNRESNEPIADSELILNKDGSVFHIHLKPEHVYDNVIVVGDQNRVERISKKFDKIEAKISNREFTTHVGKYKGTGFTIVSTGIGTDNIDIVINELDAAVNIDLEKRRAKNVLRSLNIVRIGTSGALQEDIDINSFVCSEFGLGFDGLLHFYNYVATNEEQSLSDAFIKQTGWKSSLPLPYFAQASNGLFNILKKEAKTGITATAPGFYGPQGRSLRLQVAMKDLNEQLTDFSFDDRRITNFEMETSALFGLGKMLGHNTATICAIIANRITKQYANDYYPAIDRLIEYTLESMK